MRQTYTEKLRAVVEGISPEDDDFIDELLSAARHFSSFGVSES